MAEQSMNGSETEVPPAKKIKIEVEGPSENDKSIHDTADMNLSAFEMKRILQTNCMRKTICVEGTFKGHESPAIVLLEKKIFPVEELFLKRGFFNEGTILRRLFTNDIYGNYECFPTREYNGLNVTVIHPATEKHIQKFMRKELYMVDETKEIYQTVTLPYIESKNFSLTWVDNILQHKAEQENVLFEDPDKEKGFMLVSDLKWDGDKNTLKLIALPFIRIKSIRELRASHLPLLKNIRDASTKHIKEKFDIHPSQLRIYLHYQPSYYHLHVHISYLMFETPGIYVEKAHLLSTIINNLELDSEYYSKATLSFIVQQNDGLFDKLKEHGVFGDLEIKPLEM